MGTPSCFFPFLPDDLEPSGVKQGCFPASSSPQLQDTNRKFFTKASTNLRLTVPIEPIIVCL
ncbi:hypothetical protein F511_17542 [Dorcoceras hygrometricum]|uniref:Uncharacterized protein n=1 Tax=Dorcoceras hygrometricum TaxID=472368 RepID=A0A2Z7D2Q0_9LAMI|nr:hypothetical protein F511_17542 [Dorcoceras hygrometricum]